MNHEHSDERRNGRSAGDEPPIRVKSGSIELRLMSSKHGWISGATKKEWRVDSKGRSKTSLDVLLVAVDAFYYVNTTKLDIVHSNNVTLHLEADASNHTVVTQPDSHGPDLNGNGRRLKYSHLGRIKQVQWDGGQWTGTGHDELEVLILDL